MKGTVALNNISIVLQQPRYPENIGAAARAMRNMGLGKLIVVDPENYDLHKVRKLATHFAEEIVSGIEIYEDLNKALSPYSYIIGSTARMGKQRQVVSRPSEMAQKLISVAGKNHVAIVFGPEDRGLSNDDIRFCHALVNIPTAEFSSLNLAQAVMIICYEIFLAQKGEGVELSPRLANRYELEGMYGQMKDILIKISFLNPENPDYWMNNFRRFFNRLPLRAKEVSIIRGICRQISWYGEKKFNDGLKKRC
jgi:tRNA/rRNA methyltransferase